MQVSIEVPVFKGRFLRPCIDSVLAQTSNAWTLSLLWDGGDQQSREILDKVERERDPRIRVYFADNRGIAGARQFLSGHSTGEYILPLDDDDILPPMAIEHFLQAATEHPWASLIRGRRNFIDVEGDVVNQEPWFPFGPRNYDRGMVTDLFNQSQPYLIRRSAYNRTRGWTGFSDFMGAGEDCDIFLQLEEVAHFELVDEVLYHYRLHDRRTSDALTPAAAFEMWRRLADAVLARMGLPLKRVNDTPPFVYEALPRPAAKLEDVDFVVQRAGGPSAASLRKCGVAEDAVHEAVGVEGPGTWRMAGFRATKRRMVCFLDEHVEIETRSALETLIRALDSASADLLAPRLRGEHDALLVRSATVGLDGAEECIEGARQARGEDQKVVFPSWLLGECLLVRREVIMATGGFDERYVPASLQDVDFCIQARRRGFRCAKIPLTGVIYRGSLDANWTVSDVIELRLKWRSHPALLQP